MSFMRVRICQDCGRVNGSGSYRLRGHPRKGRRAKRGGSYEARSAEPTRERSERASYASEASAHRAKRGLTERSEAYRAKRGLLSEAKPTERSEACVGNGPALTL